MPAQNALMPVDGGWMPRTMNALGQMWSGVNNWGNQQAATMAGPVYDRATRQLTSKGQQIAGITAGFAGGPSGIEAAGATSLRDLPALAPRRFINDYPGGVAADAAGQLTTDMHGQPLTAPHVAGRQMTGGADVPIAPEAYSAISQGITGQVPQAVSRAEMDGAVGLYDPTGAGPAIQYAGALPADAAGRVIGHEVSHAIDHAAGLIPQDGLEAELGHVYNAENNPVTGSQPVTPTDLGYTAVDAPREQMASAIRAYMSNPNYLKTVAPQTAGAIRNAVNTHPVLSRVVQFNSLAPVAGVGLGGAVLQPQLNALMPGQ